MKGKKNGIGEAGSTDYDRGEKKVKEKKQVHLKYQGAEDEWRAER